MSTFQVGLEHLELLELIYYSLIPIFAQYDFKTGTLCLSTAVKLDSNYFGVLLWKKVKPRTFNMKLNHQSQKYPKNINQAGIIL